MSILKVDTINEKTSGNGIYIPGHVVQVQRSSIGGNISTTSSSAVATGLECAITPKFATSLLKVECLSGRPYMDGAQLDIYLYKGGSNVNTVGVGRWQTMYDVGGHHHGGYSACYFETASSTSARTYQVYYEGGGNSVWFNNSPSGNNEYLAHLVVTEIAQ